MLRKLTHLKAHADLLLLEEDRRLASELIAKRAPFGIPGTKKYWKRVTRLVRKLELGNNSPKTAYGAFVYGIVDEDELAVKIGVTTNLKKRLSSLQSGSPVRLSVAWRVHRHSPTAAKWVERRLHREFEAARSHGEWFDIAVSVPAYRSACYYAQMRATKDGKETERECDDAETPAFV